jgi:hypothetical protein
MPPPTHEFDCRTLACYPTRCPICNEAVFFWKCTCGSRVFFDELGGEWPIHPCQAEAVEDQAFYEE